MANINFIEWDKKHREYLIRLAGDIESQETRLAKMKTAEEMYEALRIARNEIERLAMVTGYAGEAHFPRLAQIDQALLKADGKET